MRTLEEKFTGIGEVRGFVFQCRVKSEYAFLYEVTLSDDTEKSPHIWYEVFERRISKGGEYEIGGQKVVFEERELYPNANAFGAWAWTFSDYLKAESYYEKLNNRIKERKLTILNNK